MDSVNQPASGQTQNAPPADANAAPEVPISFGAWLRGNALGIAIVAGGLTALWLYLTMGKGFTTDEAAEAFWNGLKVIVGIGFIIFLHELGHFGVAKWCDVHVETFSIGFGPALPGCSFKRGETTYKIALFPLGGYVKMLGEGEGEGEGEEDDDNPRSFKNKTVGQRMAIISAGVIMNIITGCIFFVWVYMAHGERRLLGYVRSVDPGSPAWEAGVPSDARILKIDNIDDPYFDDFQRKVMLSSRGQSILFVYSPAEPRGEKVSLELTPRREKHNSAPMIGITSSLDLRLLEKRRRPLPGPAVPGTVAARAEPAFEFGDEIVGMSDPRDPKVVTPLPAEGDKVANAHVRFREYRRRLQQLAGKPVTIQVRRAAGGEIVNLSMPPAYHHTLGLRMRMGQIVAVRQKSPADEAKVQLPDPERNLGGDIIEKVEVIRRDKKKLRLVMVSQPGKEKQTEDEIVEELDPSRLPWRLREWAEELDERAVPEVHMWVWRKSENGQKHSVLLKLNWDRSRQYDEEEPNHLQSPLSIPALGLAYQIETVIDAVHPDSPAWPRREEPRLQKGDVIKEIRFQELGRELGQYTWGSWRKLASNQWARVSIAFQNELSKKVGLRVERENEQFEVELEGIEDPSWPRWERGLLLEPIQHVQTADGSFFKALDLGLNKTYRSIVTIYLSLKSILTGQISYENVGGPIMIASVAYQVAGQGFYEFLMFLALISINLAVVNYLPIPLLDGGHMVFLIYEKLRGKPASERVLWVAMIVGIAMIAAIFLFASYQDIMRWLFPGR